LRIQPKNAPGKKAAPKKAEKNGNVAAMLGITATYDENSNPSSPAISTGSGTGTPKSKTIEEIYQKKSQLEHILLRPDTYIGSVEEQKQEMWIYENEKIVKKEISFVPGLYKIVDEILVNAADNKVGLYFVNQFAEGKDVY
jgi:DNA topoisomerase II